MKMDRWHYAFIGLAVISWLVTVGSLWAFERRLSKMEAVASAPVLCQPTGLAETMEMVNRQLEEVLRQWRAKRVVISSQREEWIQQPRIYKISD